MKQLSLAETAFLQKAGTQIQKAMLLDELEMVVPWPRLESLIEALCPKKGNGRGASVMREMCNNIHYVAVNMQNSLNFQQFNDRPA